MKVSAVVPVYNSVNTLERAINSLLLQPEINEIFIVDDGSTDGSYELATKLELEYSLVKLLTHTNRQNLGASASRNLGLKYCSNNWIQFLDADDELLLEKISKQLSLLGDNVSLVVSNSIWINNKRTLNVFHSSDLWGDLILARLGNTCSNLWSKKAILNSGGWNESLINTQEYDLMFRISKQNPNIVFDSNFNTIVYEVPNSISRSNHLINIKFENQVKLRKEIFEYLKDSNLLSFKYLLYINGYLGTLRRNYKKKEFNDFNFFYYLIFKVNKSITDRFK
ncbi:glycosyltransferase family 2 protein [Algoriphagus aquatilis]|uniref:Glycosyltransferase family 2 protein n=1 Tax=Algoriphagus aquatilis TaxID=490186 RepID=A0ABW0BSM6_9BACT